MNHEAIDKLRYQGFGYRRIAAMLDIPLGSVKSYCYRHPLDLKQKVCLQCGKQICNTPHKREKKFCSDKCRLTWWNSHQHLIKKKAVYKFKCAYCEEEFEAYGNSHRIYCSRTCYANARRKEVNADG